jgi:lauroyl/myristoyl acyltransferase
MPGKGSSCVAGFRVFLQFALTYLDRLWHLHFQREVEWEIVGKDDFEALQARAGGALIFTVHSGNYDIGAGLFARRFGRAIHTVRMPEASASLQQLRQKELREEETREPICTFTTTNPAAISAWNSAANCSPAKSSASRATA